MNPWIEAIGWTLIHFIWQGGLLAIATAVALRLYWRRSAEARYVVACIGLAAMLASAGMTGVSFWVRGSVLMQGGNILAASPAPGPAVMPLRIATDNVLPFADGAARTIVTLEAFLPAMVWTWFAGVVLLLGRFSGGCWRIHRWRVASRGQAISPWQAASQRLAERLRVHVAFNVVESSFVDAPTVIGWIRPMILLPVAALANLAPGQIEALVAHELAHIRRRDYAVNLLQTIAEALFFFHPGVWWVSSRIREEREHCCDDVAVELCGEPTAYAEALAELAAWRRDEAVLSVGAGDGSLLARIRRLLCVADDDEPRAISGLVALAVSMAFVCGLAVLSPSSLVATGGSAGVAEPAQLAADRHIRHTDHFEIYYPPDLDLHADRIAREAERAYEKVSGDLKHNLAFRVPVILFHTTSDLEQTVEAGALRQPHVGSLADPSRDRILLAVDRPADEWFGLITHEVAHVFGYDILPGRTTPRWISEGLAEYERGAWDPSDLAVLRDAVRANAVPKITHPQADESSRDRLLYAVGHAAFEFIESRWGKPGVRQFLFSLRQADGSGGDPYEAAFRLRPHEFDEVFEAYLRQRFAGAVGKSPADRFDSGASLRIDGDVTAIRSPASVGLACMELWVEREGEHRQRWAVECGNQNLQNLLHALKPGDRVMVTGAPARAPASQRMLIQRLVRPSDGFSWSSVP